MKEKLKAGTLAVVATNAPDKFQRCRAKLVHILNTNKDSANCSWIDSNGHPFESEIPIKYLWYVDNN